MGRLRVMLTDVVRLSVTSRQDPRSGAFPMEIDAVRWVAMAVALIATVVQLLPK